MITALVPIALIRNAQGEARRVWIASLVFICVAIATSLIIFLLYTLNIPYTKAGKKIPWNILVFNSLSN